jgi:hypothetical protein
MNRLYINAQVLVFYIFFTILAGLQLVYGQNIFRTLSAKEKIEKLKKVRVENINQFSLLEINESKLKNYLSNVPTNGKNSQGITLEIPLPNGKTEDFLIIESSVLTPELQTLHPNIRTYKGSGLKHSDYKIRFSITSLGFSALILGVEKDVVIIERVKGNANGNLYKSYFSKEAKIPEGSTFHNRCGNIDIPDIQSISKKINNTVSSKFSNGDNIKTFKLAIAATGEFTTFRGGQTNAYSEIVTYVNELNTIFESELGLNFQLISGTNIIYTNAATDPYTASDQGIMLNENQLNLDTVIGNSNYDIGHVFGNGFGSGGGLASSPSACTNSKAKGASDIGPETSYAHIFSVQLVAHEIGHQFGMSHSYNSNIPVCTTRAYSTSVEPGSGASIMSYGFTCSNNDPSSGVTGNDDYSETFDNNGLLIGPFLNFHVVSIKQALDYIATLSCYTQSPSGNSIPVIDTMQNTYIIPKSTPFYLKGTATDANLGDVLSYSWEGTNISDLANVTGSNGWPTAPPSLDGSVINDTTHPPFFRSYSPVSTGSEPGLRYYPLLSAILDGSNQAKGDKLPSIPTSTTHSLVVRDNNGGVTTEDITVNIDSSGPFLITNDPSGTYIQSNGLTVQWSVNGTTSAPINCTLVDIWISTDGGQTFTLLSNALPNSGTATVTLPNVVTTNARIKVAPSTSTASGNVPNIFFDISNTNFTIEQQVICNAGNTGPIIN